MELPIGGIDIWHCEETGIRWLPYILDMHSVLFHKVGGHFLRNGIGPHGSQIGKKVWSLLSYTPHQAKINDFNIIWIQLL